MDQQLKEIGARLKQARLARNLTQGQLAEAAGISISFLSNIENGRQVMNIQTLIALLDSLNISADWLLNNGTDYASHAVAIEIEQELSACTAKERSAILKLIQLMKESISSLKADLKE